MLEETMLEVLGRANVKLLRASENVHIVYKRDYLTGRRTVTIEQCMEVASRLFSS